VHELPADLALAVLDGAALETSLTVDAVPGRPVGMRPSFLTSTWISSPGCRRS
jgi:hypothetical protein